MKKRELLLFFLMMSLAFSACVPKFIVSKMDIFENKASLKVIANSEMVICVIPMHHIGTRSFYDDVQLNIDTFKPKGFTVLYEGIPNDTITGKLAMDTLLRKFRKITTLPVKSDFKGYIDTSNYTLLGYKAKWIKKYNIINQPKKLTTTFDTVNAKSVDLQFKELVRLYEMQYGTIELEKADWDTPLGKRVKNVTMSSTSNYMTLDLRNQHLAKEIIEHPSNKIVVVYGAAHFTGLLNELQRRDSTFKKLN